MSKIEVSVASNAQSNVMESFGIGMGIFTPYYIVAEAGGVPPLHAGAIRLYAASIHHKKFI